MKRLTVSVITIILTLPICLFASQIKKPGSSPIIFRTSQDSVYILIDSSRFGGNTKDLCDEIDKEKWFFLDLPDSQTVNKGIKICSEKDTICINDVNWSDSIIFIFKSDTLRIRGKVRLASQNKIEQFIQRLKNDQGYSYGKSLKPIPFEYQKSNDSNLTRLRTKFNLDSVAGTGDEISRIINLMKWAHSVARHDGNSIPPQNKNSIDLIKVVRDSSRGINCWMLGIILNEAYLSMGFKSRHVWCMPLKDTTDHDCHVVTIVYSNKLSKWIMMDPTSRVYFMDTKGNILNLQELREYLKAGIEVKLNSDRDYNGNPVNLEGHIGYMTKNTYQFECGLHSEFGYDSKPNSKSFVHLVPNAEKGKHLEDLWVENDTYYTTNPNIFWAKPLGKK